MAVAGYKAVIRLMEALGIPSTTNVKRIVVDCPIPGYMKVYVTTIPNDVELESFAGEIEIIHGEMTDEEIDRTAESLSKTKANGTIDLDTALDIIDSKLKAEQTLMGYPVVYNKEVPNPGNIAFGFRTKA